MIADTAKLLKSDKERAKRVAVGKAIYDLNFSRHVYYQKWDAAMRSVGIEPRTTIEEASSRYAI